MTTSIVFIVLMILGRVLWQLRPSLFTCIIFWIVVLLSGIHDYLVAAMPVYSLILGNIGWGCNCLVTVANGGKMPVMRKRGSFVSVWRRAKKNDKFLFLCDKYSGYSVGDFFLFTSLLTSLAYIVLKDWRK